MRVDRDEELEVPPHNVHSHRVRIVPRGVYHEILDFFFFCSNLEDGVFGLETADSSAEMRREPPESCRSGQKSDKRLIPDSSHMQKKSRLA